MEPSYVARVANPQLTAIKNIENAHSGTAIRLIDFVECVHLGAALNPITSVIGL